MAIHRGIDGSEPLRPEPIPGLAGAYEERKVTREFRLAEGTLACPDCDAPVAPPHGRIRPVDMLGCPYCAYTSPARDFLSLSAPTRPARVDVMVRTNVPPLARRGGRR
ncbi:MAG TPA: hypothetical protein VHF89_14315 [Solirubrobacteraceae bacterium]|nr:hypothetical protein [Solirubrobacteraceae bacterium]